MAAVSKSVAIIGGGAAGLAAAKAALKCGLQPTVFEKREEIGGLWSPKVGSVWESMRTNISHYTCMFSDFPWDPAPAHPFPAWREVHEYFRKYVKQFGLAPYLRLGTEVQKMDFLKERGQWRVQTEKGEEHFDFALVCSGFFSHAHVPDIDGLRSFQGKVLHSKDYKAPADLRGRSVAVIGNAFSGCEIAADLARASMKVSHVFRNAKWVLPRFLPHPKRPGEVLPLDLVFYSRAGAQRAQQASAEESNRRKHAWFQSLTKQEERAPALRVETPPSDPPFIVISDGYVDQVAEGKITPVKGEIRLVTANGLEMADGSSLEVDNIVLCTGYRTTFPFLEPSVLKAMQFDSEDQLQPCILSQTVFVPEWPTLAFTGMYRGPFFGIMELQALLACKVFSGQIPAPSKEDLATGVAEELQIRHARPRLQFSHGDYVRCADDLALRVGVRPDCQAWEKVDAAFYQALWSAPFTVASYQLGASAPNVADKAANLVRKMTTL